MHTTSIPSLEDTCTQPLMDIHLLVLVFANPLSFFFLLDSPLNYIQSVLNFVLPFGEEFTVRLYVGLCDGLRTSVTH